MRYINTSIIVLLQLDFYFYSPKSIKKVRVGGFLRIGSGHGKHEPFFFSLRDKNALSLPPSSAYTALLPNAFEVAP